MQHYDQPQDLMEDPEPILCSDYFRMFVFKVERCTRMDPHDWTLCQFAHPTEKAKRRDPTKFVYNYNSCTEFRKHGSCRSGDNCAFAHGVFEGWLSAQKYHTEMCTLGRHACTRRVCFFAHSQSELREVIPETLDDTAQLKEQLLADMFCNPALAQKLQQLLSVMTPSQASEVIGERLAFLQFFLDQFGPSSLPALLRCSQSDLQDLMGNLRSQAQKEREIMTGNALLSQKRMNAQLLGRIAESDNMNLPILQDLKQQLDTLALTEADTANLLSRISAGRPPSEDQYSGRSSMDSYFAPALHNSLFTPPRNRSSALGYQPSMAGSSVSTYDARSSIDSVETIRTGPSRLLGLRSGNLFGGLPLTAKGLSDAQPLTRGVGRHSLDSAYQQALMAKRLAMANGAHASPSSFTPDLPVTLGLNGYSSGNFLPADGGLLNSAQQQNGSNNFDYTLALLASQAGDLSQA